MKQNLKQSKKRKQNMKIYSLYRMISMDIIFYYAIDFLFLTQVKNITASQYVLRSSFYAFFMIILQIPASIIVDKLGTRRCTILGNLFNAIYLFIILIAPNFETLIIAELISAICFSLKDISDSTLLTQSIPECKKKGEIFSKIEGKGQQNYYYINAITSVLAGSLYSINPYIPIVCAFLICVFATIISLGFQDVEKTKDINHTTKSSLEQTKEYFKDLKDAFKFIIKSNRLRSLILYSGIIWGVFCLASTYRTSILKDVGTSAQLIAIVSAIVGMASGIGAKIQLQFHKKFKNKSLSIILITTAFTITCMGLVGISNVSSMTILIIVTILNIILKLVQGIHGVLCSRYLGNFAENKILPKIYSVNAISRNVFRMIIGFLGSYLLDITNTSNASIITGILFTIIAISLISYMKTRLGLKPEEYKKEEINYE